MGVRHVVMLGYPDGGLEDTRELLGDIVAAIRRYRPHTVFVHDPYRMKGCQHRDHRKAGIATTDAVYPYARDHLHFPEQITRDGLEPHKVRELWYWGMDEPDVIVDVTDSIDRQIAGLIRHESQVSGFNVPAGLTIGDRVKKNAAEHAEGFGFQYGAVFRRLLARRERNVKRRPRSREALTWRGGLGGRYKNGKGRVGEKGRIRGGAGY